MPAIGALSLLLPWFPLFAQPLKFKYAHFSSLATPGPYQVAVRADELWLLTLMMAAVGLVTAVKWQSLFPGLRDYQVLGTLPLRARQIFQAKFLALLMVSTAAVVALNALPCLTFPLVSASRWQINPSLADHLKVQAMAFAAASYFCFFGLLALQGVLLNLLPPRLFGRVTGYLQGLLVAAMLLLLVLSFSIDTRVSGHRARPAAFRLAAAGLVPGPLSKPAGRSRPGHGRPGPARPSRTGPRAGALRALLRGQLPAPSQAADGRRRQLLPRRSQMDRRRSGVAGPQPAPTGHPRLHDQNPRAQQPAPHDPDGLRRLRPGDSAHRHSGPAAGRLRAGSHGGLLRLRARDPADLPAHRPAPPLHHPSRVEGQLDLPARRARKAAWIGCARWTASSCSGAPS